jgi:methylase of polypeptide subunit release factors
VTANSLPAPPAVPFADTVRAVLVAAGFTGEGIVQRMGGADVGPREHPRILRATRACTALDVLIRLFVLHAPVEEPATRAALAPSALDDWIAAGLLARSQGGVVARFALLAEVGAWIVSDLRIFAAQRDYVVGLGRSSILGIRATPRSPVASALEIGAGSGGSSVLLASHAARVVATDVNPRALAIAAFNARLNRVENLALRSGSLFEPAGGERFDLIVSNPPFAIGPSRRLRYRDGGFPLDGFVERVVRGATAHLRANGVCVLTANWVEPRDADWRARLAGWVEGSACDALFVRMSSTDPEVYATSWLGEAAGARRSVRQRAWERWVSFLDDAGVGSIGVGLIALRRSERTQRAWFLDGVEEVDADCGAALVAALDANARLSELDDAALLAERPRVSSGVRVEQVLRAGEGGWDDGGVTLRRRHGLHLSLRADPRVATVLLRSNGERTVVEVAAAVARELESGGEALAKETPRIVRLLLERGLLTLA